MLRLPSFFYPLMDIDEAEYAGVVCRMLDGGLPYRDGMMIKFPGILYVYYGAFALFGRYNMAAVHLVGALAAFCTALACRQIARRLADEAAGWWAAVLYAIFSVGFYSKMQAANTEMFAVLPAALGVLAYVEGRAEPRRLLPLAFVAGLLSGGAVLFKQPAALLPLALAAGGLVEALRRRTSIGREVIAGALLGLGAATTLAAMALHFALRGILGDAIFWTWTYIWFHYFPSVRDSILLRLLGTPVPLVLSMAPAVVLALQARGERLWPLWWWLAAMFATGFTGGRMFGHYFLLAVPPLCVLAGIGGVRLWSELDRPRWRAAIVAVTCLLAFGQLVGAALWEASTDSFWSPKPDYRPAAEFLRKSTRPDERVFIWGRSPVLYVASDRCPSTRFVYAHHLAGASQAQGGLNAHSVPEGWRQLLEDLERQPPPYIVDTSHGQYDFQYAPIESYPLLWRIVSEQYELETELAGVRFYRRRAR